MKVVTWKIQKSYEITKDFEQINSENVIQFLTSHGQRMKTIEFVLEKVDCSENLSESNCKKALTIDESLFFQQEASEIINLLK
jgi:hypothetical protein